jgi:Photosystem II complex subunit Ycf12
LAAALFNLLSLVTRQFGGKMEALANINWEVIFQLVSVALIMIAGPVVIFLLAFRGGNM